MHRRHFLAFAAPWFTAPAASAGVMDWFNGVRLGHTLPAHDAQLVRPLPADSPKLMLIDFWATWCAPCREEFPHLNALHETLGPQGLAVLGLTQEPVAKAQEFLARVDIRYAVGAGGRQPLQAALGIRALPYAVLVDREQKIVWKGQASRLGSAELRQRLQAA